ncbi:MAG: hypothetical protein V2A58_01175 [Planctomycetota bacterium]
MQALATGAVLLLSIVGALLAGEEPAVIFNSGFEEEPEIISDAIPPGADPTQRWRPDDRGENIVEFTRETQRAHSGRFCLKSRCLWWRWGKGSVGVLSPRFRLLKDKKYVLRLWLRGESLSPKRAVALMVRNSAVQDAASLPGKPLPATWAVHAERRCSVSAEWQEYVLNIAPEYDADVEIRLRYESVGTVWLDDVSVSEGGFAREKTFGLASEEWVPAQPSKEPPRKGNLLYNGSFEVGTSGWGPLKFDALDVAYNRRHYGARRMSVTAEKTDAFHGQYALRVDATASDLVESEYIQVRPGQEITLSAYMRAEREPTTVSLAFIDGAQITYMRFAGYGTRCDVSTEWQRFSVSGRLPASANNGIVVQVWGGKEVFLVDGVQVEEGDLTPFDVGGEVELGTSWHESETGIYRPGETTKVRLYTFGEPHARLKVESHIEDYYGKTRLTFESDLALDSKGDGFADLAFQLPAPGIYRLVSDAPGTKRAAERILVQVRKANAPRAGIHTQLLGHSFRFARDTCFGWWRLSDYFHITGWTKAEPEKGKFVYDDDGLELVLSTGVKVLATLGGYGVPEWAKQHDPKDPDAIALAAGQAISIEDWKDYVRAMVRHYKDRIRHWEIWNEPRQCGISPEHYFRLCKEAYTLIKAEDPEAFVVGGGGLYYRRQPSDPYIEKLFSLGALEYMDAYSFHGYFMGAGDPWKFGEGLRELMVKNGKVVPLWDSEWGKQCNTFRRISYYGGQHRGGDPTYSYRTAVNMSVRHELSERALGVEASFWFLLDKYSPIRNNSGGLMTLFEYDDSPRATVPALINIWELLGEADLVETLSPSDIARVYTFTHPAGALFAVDALLPEELTAQVVLPLDREGEQINVMGERTFVRPRGGELMLAVSDEPLLVLFKGAEAEEIARAVKGVRFVGMPPARVAELLVIDPRNEPPQALRGARYEREVPLGVGLAGWVFSKADGEFLVFAGEGPAGSSQTVSVSKTPITICDSLGNEVPVDDGRIVIYNGAPYVAVGDNPEESLKSASAATSPGAGGSVFSSGFEEEFEAIGAVTHPRGDSARCWVRDNYGENVVQFTRETRDPHSGRSCLKLNCPTWHSGMAAVLSPRFRILKDRKYVLRLWLRADSLPSERSVAVAVRNAAVQDVVPLPGQVLPKKWAGHASRRCSATVEWQEYVLNIAPEYDADVEIQLGYESVGTVWIDDVSVSEGSVEKDWAPAPPSKEPPRKGNLLYNGSFEVGTSGWGSLNFEPLDVPYNRRHFGARHFRVTTEKTDAFHGQYVLRVDGTGSDDVESEYIRVRPGQKITVSAYLKAEKEPTRVSLAFLDGSMIKYCQWASYGETFDVTTEWQRFSVSGRLPATANNGIIVRIRGGKEVFLVDAVQVEEGDLTAFETVGEVELGSVWQGSETGVYRPGQTSKVRVYAFGKPHTNLKVESHLEDYYGTTRMTFESHVALDSEGNGFADLEIELPAAGIYRLISDAPGAKRPAERILVEVIEASASYAGIHTQLYRNSLALVKDAGFGWWRLSDYYNIVGWQHAEPESDKFVYYDEGLAIVQSTGVEVLACLGGYGTPKWVKTFDPKDPDAIVLETGEAFNIADWKDYVGAMVRNYKDRIKCWEIWNEPGMPDPAHYFRLVKEASTIIKGEDPQATVIGGYAMTASEKAETLISLGILDYLDGWTFHGYCVDGGDPWEFGRGLKELMAKHGKVIPFWDTEWGVQCNTFRRTSYYGGQPTYRWPSVPYRTAVNMAARHELSEKALGVVANFWFLLDRYSPVRNNSGGLMTLLEYDNASRATLPALANTWGLLGEAELVEMLSPSDIARVYTFTHPAGALFAVDTKLPEGLSAQLILPVNLAGEQVNVMGERSSIQPRGGALALTLSDEPVFVLFKGADPGQIAAAAKEARFVRMPPAEAVNLLSFDPTNQAPELLRGARYEREVPLGFGLTGWVFSKADGELVIFAGEGAPDKSRSISVTDSETKIFDCLGRELQVADDRVEIANRAAYVAVGKNCETSIGSPGSAGGANLLENPSFEEGEDRKTPARWTEWTRFSGESTFVKQMGGRTPESKGMAVLVQSPKDAFVIAEQLVKQPLAGGERYGFSAWIRSARPVRADVYLEVRGATGSGLCDGRSRHTITTSWAKYSTSVMIPEGTAPQKGALRAIVQLFENPNTEVEIDDAELHFLGVAPAEEGPAH